MTLVHDLRAAAAAFLLASCGEPAVAQPTGAPGSASAPPAEHVASAEDLAQAHRLLDALHMRERLTQLTVLTSGAARTQFEAGLAALPAAKKTQALAVFDAELARAAGAHARRTEDHQAGYYASHVASGGLEKMAAFYEGPLGQKMITDPQGVTAEDRQHAGRVFLSDPGLFQMLQAEGGLLQQTGGAWSVQERTVFRDDLLAHLCTRLRAIQVRYSTCPAGRV